MAKKKTGNTFLSTQTTKSYSSEAKKKADDAKKSASSNATKSTASTRSKAQTKAAESGYEQKQSTQRNTTRRNEVTRNQQQARNNLKTQNKLQSELENKTKIKSGSTPNTTKSTSRLDTAINNNKKASVNKNTNGTDLKDALKSAADTIKADKRSQTSEKVTNLRNKETATATDIESKFNRKQATLNRIKDRAEGKVGEDAVSKEAKRIGNLIAGAEQRYVGNLIGSESSNQLEEMNKLIENAKAKGSITDKEYKANKQSLQKLSNATGIPIGDEIDQSLQKTGQKWASAGDKKINNVTKDSSTLRKLIDEAGVSSIESLQDRLLGTVFNSVTFGNGWIVPMGLRVMNQSYDQAKQTSATDLEARRNAIGQALVEVGTEKLSSVGKVGKFLNGKGLLTGVADKATDAIQKGITNTVAKNIAGVGSKVALSGLGEGLEEGVSGVLSPIVSNLTYAKNVDTRTKEGIMSMAAESESSINEQISQIRKLGYSEDEAKSLLAKAVKSDDYISELVSGFSESGFKDKSASKLANLYADYLSAVSTGEGVKKARKAFVNEYSSLTSVQQHFDARDTIEQMAVGFISGTMMSGVVEPISSVKAGQVKKDLGEERVKSLTKHVAESIEDESMASRASAMYDYMENGGEISNTQFGDVLSAYQEHRSKQQERFIASAQVAEATTEKENLTQIQLYGTDIDGNGTALPVGRYVTAHYFDSAANNLNAVETSAKQLGITLEEDTSERYANAVTKYEMGLLTVDDVDQFGYENQEARSIFEAITGETLPVKTTLTGKVDIAKTNAATYDYLFGKSAENYIETARQETAWEGDYVKGKNDLSAVNQLGSTGTMDYLAKSRNWAIGNPDEYITNQQTYMDYYRAGLEGAITFDEMNAFNNPLYEGLDLEARRDAYNSGTADATTNRGSLTTYLSNEMAEDFGAIYQEAFSIIANRTGLDIIIVDDLVENAIDKEGNPIKVRANGKTTGNEIWINVNKGVDKGIEETFMHEFTHTLEETNAYEQFKDLIVNTWTAKDKAGFDAKLSETKEKYRKLYNNVSEAKLEDLAIKEMIADIAPEMLKDKQFVDDACQDLEFGRKVLEAIKSALRKLREVFAFGSGYTKDINTSLLQTLDILTEAEELWMKAVSERYESEAKAGLIDSSERYSLVSQEEADEHRQVLVDQVKEYYGEGNEYTNKFSESGFLYPNGKLLRMGTDESRAEDHVLAEHAYPKEYHRYVGTKSAVGAFINEGNIRFMPESGAINLGVSIEPTEAQYEQLYNFIRWANRQDDMWFALEFSNEDNRTVDSKEYGERANADEVINDIKRFYKTGSIGGSQLSQFRYSLSTEEIESEMLKPTTDIEASTAPNVRFSAGDSGTFYSPQPHAYSGTNPTGKAKFDKNRQAILKSGEEKLKEVMSKNIRARLKKQGIKGKEATEQINKEIDNVLKFMRYMNDMFVEMTNGDLYTFVGFDDVVNQSIKVRKDKDGKVIGVSMSAMIKNGEYPVNFDFTTICKRRGAFNKIIETLSKEVGSDVAMRLTPEQLMEINKALKAENVETACLGCFVEARRYHMQNYTTKVVELWNSIVDEEAEAQGIKNVGNFGFAENTEPTNQDYQDAIDTFFNYDNAKVDKRSPDKRFRQIIKSSNGKYLKHITAADLVTPKGIEKIRAMGTYKYDLLGMFKSAYGVAAPKETIAYTPYNSEIAFLPKTEKYRKYLKKIGGVRMQSFSDFLIANTFDYMQMVADMAAKGFPAHAYSKEISFAKIFGLTGIKINMSVMFDVDDAATWGNAFNISDEAEQLRIARKYAGLQFYKTKKSIPKSLRSHAKKVTENGVSGYVTFLVSDQARSDRQWEVMYRTRLTENGGDETEAKKYANERRKWVQSIDFELAKELETQEGYSKNCGIIGVGLSDECIRMMLDDKYFPFIIPYHASGLPDVIKVLTNLNYATNYEDSQNTRIYVGITDAKGKTYAYEDLFAMRKKEGSWQKVYAKLNVEGTKYEGRTPNQLPVFDKDGKPVLDKDGKQVTTEELNKDGETYNLAGTAGFDFYGYLDKGLDPKEVSEKYLEYCAEYGLLPVFPQFAGHKNYYKLLVDYNVMDLVSGTPSPQGAVSNNYPGVNIDKGESNYSKLEGIIKEEATTANKQNEKRDKVVKKVADTWKSKFSLVSAEEDAAYMQAVANNDMETAQRMVDEAAERAGYTTDAYHGASRDDFNIFDLNGAKYPAHGRYFGDGFYFSSSKSVADSFKVEVGYERNLKTDEITEYHGRTIHAKLKMENPVDVDYEELIKEKGFKYQSDVQRAIKKMITPEHDGLIIRNIADNTDEKATVYVVFEPNQIKSADPVTYDDNGQVIPLSERFNAENNDIRWSLSDGGYDGYSMSNRARDAYESGEKPLSKWTKKDIISKVAENRDDLVDALKKIPLNTLKNELLYKSSWHHTSAMYNITNFYSIDENKLESLTEDDISKWDTTKPSVDVISYRGKIDYIEWTGSKKHPKANKKSLDNVNIEERGSFYYVTDDNGNEILKKKIGSNGTYVTNYDLQQRLEEERQQIEKEYADNSSQAALDFLNVLKEEGYERSNSGNMYIKGRKPSSADYDNLENFFEVGEHRLVDNKYSSPKSYTLETWDGQRWVSEYNENPDIRFSTIDQDTMEEFINEQADSIDGVEGDEQMLNELRQNRADFLSEVRAMADSIVKKQTQYTHGKVLDEKKVARDVQKLLEYAMQNTEYTGKYKNSVKKDVVASLKVMFKQIQDGDAKAASDTAIEMASYIVDSIELVNDEMYRASENFRNYMRNVPIRMIEDDMVGIDWPYIRRHNFGRIRFTRDGATVDQVWENVKNDVKMLVNKHEWDVDEISNTQDMILAINDALDATVPVAVVRTSEETTQLLSDVASDLFDIAFEADSWLSFADKKKIQYDEKTKKLKERQKEAIRDLRANYYKLLNESIRNEKRAARRAVRMQKKIMKIADRNLAMKNAEERKKHFQELAKQHKGIQKNYDTLVKMLLEPNTKTMKLIPEEFRKSVASLLVQLDLQTQRSKDLEATYGISAKTYKAGDIRKALKKIAETEDENFMRDESHSEYISDLADFIDKQIDWSKVRDMDLQTMSKLNDFLATLISAFNTHNKTFVSEKAETVSEIGHKIVDEANELADDIGMRKTYDGLRGAVDKLISESSETPIDFFELMGPAWTEVYMGVRRGMNRNTLNMNYMRKYIEEVMGGFYNKKKPGSSVDAWREDYKEYTLENGNKITLTPAQIMSLYCHNKREQSMGHIMVGGVAVSQITTKAKGVGRVLGSEIKTQGQATTISCADIEMLIDTLTDEQKEVADKLQNFLSTTAADWGNEVSMKMYGVKLFKEKNYFPIAVSSLELNANLEEASVDSPEKIMHFGFTKALKPKAGQALVLEDIIRVFCDHCNKMSLYNAYAMAVSDFQRIYNYRERDAETGKNIINVKEKTETVYGKQATKYIRKFMADVNGNTQMYKPDAEQVVDDILTKYKKATIGFNPRVAIQQPIAIVRALNVLDAKYFLKGGFASPKDRTRMLEHSPIAMWKSWGNYQNDYSRGLEDIMLNKDWSKMDVITMMPYGLLDDMTWACLYKAVEAETKDKHPDVEFESEEYWKLVNDRFDYVIDHTQVVDSVFHRSDVMRSQSGWAKLFTSFMAEPARTFNMVRTDFVEAYRMIKQGDKKGAAKKIARVTLVFLGNALAVSLASALIDAIRYDDDDPTWLENLLAYFFPNFKGWRSDDNSYLGKVKGFTLTNFIDNSNMLHNIFLVKDFVGAIEDKIEGNYYGSSNMILQGVEKLATASIDLLKKASGESDKSTWKLMYETADALSLLSGVPAKNFMRVIENVTGLIGVDVDALESLDDEETESIFQKLGIGSGKSSDGSSDSDSSSSDISVKELTSKAKQAASGKKGSAKKEALWDAVNDGYAKDITNGDMTSINKRRQAYVNAGGNKEDFDEKISSRLKTEYKKSIGEYDDAEKLQKLRNQLVKCGYDDDDISEIARGSNVAQKCKAAMMLRDDEEVRKWIWYLAEAGLTQDDLDYLWEKRSTGTSEVKTKYLKKLMGKSSNGYVWPTTGTITDGFGYRTQPCAGASTYHEGIDIAASRGTTVSAAKDGTVISAGYVSSFGYQVVVDHGDGDVTYYSHLYSYNVLPGDYVSQGQKIGGVGSTGTSTGNHLDFRVQRNGEYIDPLTILQG